MTGVGFDLGLERDRLAATARRLAAAGLVPGSSGNVSARAGDRVAITRAGARLADLEPSEVTVVDLAGRTIQGAPPSSELALHLRVYARFGAGAVVHSHPPIASALSAVLVELPVVHYGMMALGGSVRVAPYARFGTDELATVTVQALAGRAAALMANHGAVAYGEDLEVAVERTLLLEWACSVYWRAASIGTPRVLSEPEQAEVKAALPGAAEIGHISKRA